MKIDLEECETDFRDDEEVEFHFGVITITTTKTFLQNIMDNFNQEEEES